MSDSMAYASHEDMMFGTAKRPVETKRCLVIGGGHVIPELIPHPRTGSETSMGTIVREFERANEEALERCVTVGHPRIVIENEHVFQMTVNAGWGMEIAARSIRKIEEYDEKYGLKAAYRSTIADVRKPDMVHMRTSDRAQQVLESFEAGASKSGRPEVRGADARRSAAPLHRLRERLSAGVHSRAGSPACSRRRLHRSLPASAREDQGVPTGILRAVEHRGGQA